MLYLQNEQLLSPSWDSRPFMTWGQRGRRAPRGKLASNLSITDSSYRAWADMRSFVWTLWCYYTQPLAFITRLYGPVHGELTCSGVVSWLWAWLTLDVERSLIFHLLQAGPVAKHALQILPLSCFLSPLLFYFDTQHNWLQVGAGKGHLFVSGERSWWRGMTFASGQAKGMKVRQILGHRSPHPLINSINSFENQDVFTEHHRVVVCFVCGKSISSSHSVPTFAKTSPVSKEKLSVCRLELEMQTAIMLHKCLHEFGI